MNLRILLGPEVTQAHRQAAPEPTTVWTLAAAMLRQWRLIAAVVGVGMAIVTLALVLMKPIYTAEATLQLNFNREDSQTSVVSRQVASMDPGALVNGAAERISSRTNIMRAAKVLGLEDQFRERSLQSRVVGFFRRIAGTETKPPTPLELAAEHIARHVKVTYKTHLYNIGIVYTDEDPRRAADVANAIAAEYLRGERLRDLTEQRVAATSELALVSDRLGARHPRRSGIEMRLERINADIATVEAAAAEPATFLSSGQFITVAEPGYLPASQNKPAIFLLALAGLVSLAGAAAFWADRMQPRLPLGFVEAAPKNKWQADPVH